MAEGVAEVYAADPAVAGAGLDEEDFVRLFVALIDQESRFNPTAVSPKGARGRIAGRRRFWSFLPRGRCTARADCP